jgi:SAM-dependent methyltransferase
LLWRGDFHNAKMLVQALGRRTDSLPARQSFKSRKQAAQLALAGQEPSKPALALDTPAQAFAKHRLAQAQRARVLGMVLVSLDAGYGLNLRRAPDVQLACTEVWGSPEDGAEGSVTSLRELQGITSTHEWRKKGVEVAALGDAPNNRIHPHYGVFSPVRGEYLALVAKAPLPVSAASKANLVAFDVGTGTGVIAAVLARRGLQRITATDMDARALACAQDNINRLEMQAQVQVVQANLFPEGKAHLIVCNPPWLPAKPASPIEHAVYDEGSQMLLGFLNGLAAHLHKGGEGWLILSDLAEHLGLRTRDELLAAVAQAGLKVVARLQTRPIHPKAQDKTDALHAARAKEITSLWRLAVV